jgi:threonine 3-dehydrogenase
MIAMLENGLDVRRVITHRFKVDQFEAGFEAMRSGQSGKVVLDWG